jgi:hypothetical protein
VSGVEFLGAGAARRGAIEPLIGQLKADGRRHRNQLTGTTGDGMKPGKARACATGRAVVRHF